ncbi:hypothetical protein BCR36DRAFT_339944 [Piromyces finnis]|uniref:Uncharacterized protein n=1 Tax=Piromyces finnis TaxID=1754191 RepID=A0A1Y1UT32_9FUNG|nr:hypothetical protein BCR36DRAFT_339944 [Piromyces finnis]|eukprot:ORX40365.1 hypothetical protein BCR36DRAFT_339944 [Piromyces finnis]
MNDTIIKLKHYWIFLITIIFYCIGFSIHFIAQHEGTKPHIGKEDLKNASPNISKIYDTTSNNSNVIENSELKYSKPDNLLYFAQISDIHMSDVFTKGAQGHLFYFLKKLIPIIEPNFLFITGDITNSKNLGGVKFGTHEVEWKMYHKILEYTGVLNKNNGTFLWDLRGNHDCFLVPEWNHQYNYFKDYSKTKTRGFSFNYETSFGSYSFIGLDGCPIYTATNPFFGVIDEITMDMFSESMDKAKEQPQNKHNFVFIHYPETTAKFGKSSSGKKWEDYTKDISLLLSGHFHNIAGEYMYAYHNNFLELELNDFKLHGKYRIIAVDNDIVSVTDNVLPLPKLPYDFKTSVIEELNNNPPEVFKQNIPPIVHITSPKNSKFILKTKEPVNEALASNIIRVLVFSSQSSENLKLSFYIDNKLQSTQFEYVGNKSLNKRSNDVININSRNEKNQSIDEKYTYEFNTPPLWIAKWDSSLYNDGKSHQLKIVAIDNNNQKGENAITFRHDGKKDDLNTTFFSKLVLTSVLVKSLPILFGIEYIIYELIILLPRFYSIKYIIPNHPDLPFLPTKYIGDVILKETKSLQNSFFKRAILLPFIEAFTFNGIFYPLQILVICLLVLPAKIGIMARTSEHISRFFGEFLYGLYGSGQWANTFDQYGMYMVIFFLIPFINTIIIVYLNHKSKRNHIISLLFLSILGIFQMLIAFLTSFISGGIFTVILSPFPVWICLYSWFLIILIVRRRIKNHDKDPEDLEKLELAQ